MPAATVTKTDDQESSPRHEVTYVDIDSLLEASLPWIDSVGKEYVRYSKNELVRNAVACGYNEEWLWDQLLVTDSSKYLVLHIGHDFQSRYVTDGWLYVDTATREVYEYKGEGELVHWKK